MMAVYHLIQDIHHSLVVLDIKVLRSNLGFGIGIGLGHEFALTLVEIKSALKVKFDAAVERSQHLLDDQFSGLLNLLLDGAFSLLLDQLLASSNLILLELSLFSQKEFFSLFFFESDGS
jgi:hypothetical protein